MRVKIDEVKQTLLKTILNKSSLSESEAEILAGDYLEGELQGRQSHGLAAFASMVPKLGDDRHEMEILKDLSAYLYIDAHDDYGAIVGRKAAELLIDKAKTQGVGLALIRNMKTWLRPATIVQYVADHGMLGIAVNTGGVPMVAPPGGKEPVIGTNPIGIGIPLKDKPLIADMASSKRAWGEVRLAQQFKHDLPPDSFLDSEGQVTLDPNEAHSAVAMGNYKGFALGLLIEILGGSLIGMNMGKGDEGEDYRTRSRGAMILVINPETTVGTEQFKKQTRTFVDSIHKSPPVQGKEVTLPGDRSSKIRETNMRNGYLEIDDSLWSEIRALA